MQKIGPLQLAFIIMLLVIFILPFFSAAEYSIIRHTTSQLAAQKTPNAWLMRLVFVMLGAATFVQLHGSIKGHLILKLIIAVFSLGLIGSAIFSHAPIDTSISFDMKADQYHSFFASLTGMGFVSFAVAVALILRGKTESAVAAIMAVSALVLSMLIFNFDATKGIWQRLMFISSFAWLIHISAYFKSLS